jgi:hypothetical protein
MQIDVTTQDQERLLKVFAVLEKAFPSCEFSYKRRGENSIRIIAIERGRIPDPQPGFKPRDQEQQKGLISMLKSIRRELNE